MTVKAYSPVVYLVGDSTAYTYNPDGSGTLVPISGGSSSPSAVAIQQLTVNGDIADVDNLIVLQTVDIVLDVSSYIFITDTASINAALVDSAVAGRIVYQVQVDTIPLFTAVYTVIPGLATPIGSLITLALTTLTPLAAGSHTIDVLWSRSAEIDNAQVQTDSMLVAQQVRAV